MNENNPTERTKVKKPKWLKVLEKQSWQAELIVSGLAIIGTLQLPSLIKDLEKYAIYSAPEKLLEISLGIFLVFYIIAQSLIIGFLVHFILRAFWIGMLGLVSAYPQGINWDYKTYMSPHFLAKLREDLPDVNVFNKRLDDFCSLIFSLSSLLSILYLPIMIFGLIIMGIAHLIHLGFPNVSYFKIALILISIFLTPSIISNVFHHKKLRDKSWVKKIQFPLYKMTTLLLINIFYLPFHYITYIFQSNVGQYKFGLYFFVPVFLIVFSLGSVVKDSKMKLLEYDYFQVYQNQQTEWYPNQYEENLNGDIPLGITIPSYEIHSDFIQLFIPRMKREDSSIDRVCNGRYKKNDDLNLIQNDSVKLVWMNECFPKYYQVYINDSLQTDLEYLSHAYPHTSAKGYITFLSTQNCKKGKNVIRVVTGYRNSEDEESKEFRVPFFMN